MDCEVYIDKTGKIIMKVSNRYVGRKMIIPMTAENAFEIGTKLAKYGTEVLIGESLGV